ncbi:MAG: bifunctional 5,10-methylenetetrahydrofolate dehydrogenase/5,10-methenyltetrahydrofolate cyclohydrolase [Firmicutes bacterium]|uniref:Bifunctional protein FolD n=1 Tax=Candidatus Onthovivens merdipullorum TaxID=2840889 RepID=A0A9D9GX47_9BACL|nr:bifunctional 5,10-methylenetetrahydrofolate dehydrogenase/5,10-methenyltetrahydrofolate cyclohydrolase [Candidatus Onthovivens merdipullorum]
MQEIKEYVAKKKLTISHFILENKLKLKLVIVQVNDDPASNSYIKGKLKDLNEVGIEGELIKLPSETTQNELLSLVNKLNKDNSVTGFIVQMPLPNHIDENIIKENISITKDVDGFNLLSKINPATPNGIVTFLKDNQYDFTSKNALVIGRSNIVGKPMAKLLLSLNMNVTVVHSFTKKDDLSYYIKNADLIIVAVGKPNFLTNEFIFKKDAIVFDVGINRIDGHLVGDCEKNLKVSYQSPVPGGVGLLTRLSLLLNLLEVYRNGI